MVTYLKGFLNCVVRPPKAAIILLSIHSLINQYLPHLHCSHLTDPPS